MLDWLKEILGEGYTDEVDKKISEQIGKDFVSRADFNTTNEAKKQLESQAKEHAKQLKELKGIDAEGMQAKITELEAANARMEEESRAAILQLKMDHAVEKALAGANVCQNKAVLPFLDLDIVKLSEDGTLTGLAEQIKKLKESDETKFLFRAEEEKPVPKGTLPGQGRDGLPGGEPDYSKMTYEEIAAHMEAHPET